MRIRTYVRDRSSLLARWLLLNGIIWLSKRWPEPTEENVWHPNARILFKSLKEYLAYEQNESRKALIQAIFRVLIDEYQRHTFYRYRIDWLVDLLRKSEWLSRSTKPMSFWGEPVEKKEGTVFPSEKLARIMGADKKERPTLIQDLILSAGEDRVFKE